MTRPASLVSVSVRMAAATAAVLALSLALISCGNDEEELAPDVTRATPTTGVATPVAASAVPTTSPVGNSSSPLTVTYKDPAYGFSFDYPAKWYLSTPKETGGDLVLQSYDPATAPGIGGITKDRLKALIRVQEGVNQPVEQWLAESRNQPGQPPPPTILSTSQVTIGGKGGLVEISEYEGQKSVAYYLAIGGGRLLVISAAPADSVLRPQFESALATLRFES